MSRILSEMIDLMHLWRRTAWRTAAAVLLVLTVLALTTTIIRTPLGPDPAHAAGPCSWYGEADQRDVNFGAPDLNAQYLYAPLDGVGGGRIEITGAYPHARYFSFTLYGSNQQAETSIYDEQIGPDPGSYNPFRGPGDSGQSTRYTVHVLFESAPAHPAQNTIYAGPATATNSLGFMVLRIYTPQSAASPSGSVPWPQVSVLSKTGAREFTEGACATTPPSFGAWYWKAYAQESALPSQSTPPAGTASPPTWTRSFSNGFGNQQNSYLQVLISHHWGQLVVAHFKAPTFPNTTAGAPVYGRHDLRYWSVCTYDSSGTAVFGCVPDYEARQTRGWVTFVVSEAGQRPPNASLANDVSWLPWGPDNEIQIMERNMLPEASFAGASQRIGMPAQNAAAAKLMGNYYPTSAYCSEATFERGGWRACLPALAKELASPKAHKPGRKAKKAHRRAKVHRRTEVHRRAKVHRRTKVHRRAKVLVVAATA
jgi:hypothetical protein